MGGCDPRSKYCTENNTIANGTAFRLSNIGGWTTSAAVKSVMVIHNNLTNANPIVVDSGGSIGTQASSPNP